LLFPSSFGTQRMLVALLKNDQPIRMLQLLKVFVVRDIELANQKYQIIRSLPGELTFGRTDFSRLIFSRRPIFPSILPPPFLMAKGRRATPPDGLLASWLVPTVLKIDKNGNEEL